MNHATEELPALAPHPVEILFGSFALLHVLLLVLLVALVVAGKVRVPPGGEWIVLLLFVPVAGPLLALLRGRQERRVEDA